MRAYIIRRLFLIIPTLFLITILVFLLVRFVPGDVIDMMLAQMSEQSGMGAELTADYLRAAMGLDQPLLKQYGIWMGFLPNPLEGDQFLGVVQGYLGESLWKNKPVLTELIERLPISIELGLIAMITGWALAMPIGIYSALRQDTTWDYLGRSFAIVMLSVPGFWLATMVIVYPSIWWSWTPSLEYIPFLKNPGGNLLQFLLPGFLMGTNMSGGLMRMVRTMVLEVMRQDYIRTAWSKGLNERTVIIRHALKNALMPVVTIAGMMLPSLIAGSVIMEQIFCLPGVGRLTFEALTQRDYPIISGINLVMATTVLFCNLLTDITYAWMDPRVQYR
ncbi:MAG: glutathione ABC transporter permease GsiC [Chloroflexi bacterium RBG_13_46_14]|nr:MAG: glutathione ABC transporter permease GsiC [Chloroflexi bacterium RBG_13_46_14]